MLQVEELRVAARRYPNAALAAQALGCSAATFRRLCRHHDIEWSNHGTHANTDTGYVYYCGTPRCQRRPVAEGLCFNCFADLRTKVKT